MLIILTITYTTVQKFGVSMIFKEINGFIQQRCTKLIKSECKDIYNVTKMSISN